MKFDEKLFACVNSNVAKIEAQTDIGTVLNKSIMCYDEPPHIINCTLIVSDVIYFIFVVHIIVLILLICIIIVYLINKKYNVFFFFVIWHFDL